MIIIMKMKMKAIMKIIIIMKNNEIMKINNNNK